MAELIQTNGIRHVVTPANGHTFRLDEVEALVDGPAKLISHLPDGKMMLVHEDGARKRLAFNSRATFLFRSATNSTETIVGDVVLAMPQEFRDEA